MCLSSVVCDMCAVVGLECESCIRSLVLNVDLVNGFGRDLHSLFFGGSACVVEFGFLNMGSAWMLVLKVSYV